MVNMIVKVQLPLASTQPTNDALLYGRGHKYRELRPLTEEERAMMGDAPKRYFHASWSGRTWTLLRDAGPQQW